MSATSNLVRVDRVERLAQVEIHRPDALNALNAALLTRLSEVFTELKADGGVRGVIITGAGDRAFVAGADIGELARLTQETAPKLCHLANRTFGQIESLGKPVVAAVGGYALGGGCELALACHLRVASEDAVFGLPEVGLGAIPGFGGTVRLARLIGLGRALDVILTGRQVQAEEADRLGLINRMVPRAQLLDQSRSLLEEILKNGPLAIEAALDSVYYGIGASLDSALAHESSLFARLVGSEDLAEGMEAFLEKRSPRFRGR
jgi:enoyl-CoA hydratase